MDEQLSRERADEQKRGQETTDSSDQDQASGQADAEGKPPANAAESGPPDQTGEGTGARAGEYR
jgi:hypothetical protein